MANTILLSPLSLALVLAAVWGTAVAGTVHPVAYETAIQKGPLTEPAQGYGTGGYRVQIDLDEEYHDWQDRPVAGAARTGAGQGSEFAAFETQEPFSMPWELEVVD